MNSSSQASCNLLQQLVITSRHAVFILIIAVLQVSTVKQLFSPNLCLTSGLLSFSIQFITQTHMLSPFLLVDTDCDTFASLKPGFCCKFSHTAVRVGNQNMLYVHNCDRSATKELGMDNSFEKYAHAMAKSNLKFSWDAYEQIYFGVTNLVKKQAVQ